MKILIVNNVFYPYQRGGAEQVVAQLAQVWSASGHQIEVVALRPHQQSSIDLVSDYSITYWPSRYYDLANWSIIRRFIWHCSRWLGWTHYWLWKKTLESTQPDLVVVNNLTGFGLSIHHWCQRLGITSVQICHDVQYLLPSGLLLLGQEEKLNHWLVRGYRRLTAYWFKSAQLIISPSAWLKDFYINNHWLDQSPWLVLPNPVTEPLADSYCLPEQLRQAIFVGQLTEAKGVRWLAEQWSDFNRILLTNGYPEVELNIVGDGPLLELLKKSLANDRRLRFNGRVDKVQVLKLIEQADVLIMPSFCYENWPTVLLETAMAGRMAIVTQHGGGGQLAEQLNFLTFQAGNLDSLIEAWQNLADTSLKIKTWPGGGQQLTINPDQYLLKIIEKINHLNS